MGDAWDDITGTRQAETFAEAMERSIAGKPQAELTEQQQAERLVESRDRMRKLDDLFRDDFISPVEQVVISRTLAKRLGYHVGDDRATGQPDIDDRMDFGDAD